MKLILASASKGRKHLLNQLKISYEIIQTNLDEEKIIANTPLETINLRAKMKGEEALKQITDNRQQTTKNKKPITYNLKPKTFLILTADTEVILDNKLFGKPRNYDEAYGMLKMLSGKTHEVVTAVYIIIISNFHPPADGPIQNFQIQKEEVEIYEDHDISRVTFKKLADNDIKRYLRYTDYTRYTGAYALVASPQHFVTKVDGSISNVIGLPMEIVIPILEKYKIV